MTTQYTPILKLALPVTGELSGTWGDVVNDNITSMVEQAIAGLATISTWTGNSHTLTTANGTTSESRCAMLVAQNGAGLTAAGEIVCPASSKLYVLKNDTSYAITLKTSGGTGVAVAAGDTAFLFCDGTNVNSCVTTIVNGHITGNLTVDGNATINGNTTLGNATSDTITATARFASGLTPSADNTYDLGSSGNSWKDLWIDGTATMALVAISGGTINGVSIGATTPATFLAVDNLSLDGNTIASTNTNGNVVIAPNGTGDVQLDADTVRVGDSAAAVTLTSNGAGALTVTTGGAANLVLSTNSGTTSGTITINNGANGNIAIVPDGTGDVQLDADTIRVGDSNTDVTITSNGTGNLNLSTNGGTNSGTIQIAQGANGNITLTPNGTGSVSVPKLVWSNGTSTRVPYLTTGGQFTDSANLTFNGTDLTVSGAVNAGSVNATTLDLTNLEVTNIKAKDGTAAASIADSTGAVTVSTLLNVDNLRLDGNTLSSTNTNGAINLTPNGTGQVTVTNDALVNSITVGRGAGAVSTNTAVGASALAANSTGAYSTAIGYQASYYQTGNNNTVLGYVALYGASGGSSTGVNNTAVGYAALNVNSSGSYNVGLGAYTLQANTTASNNTAVGYQAGYTNQTGTDNTFVGQSAGYNLTTSYNTLVGLHAGYGYGGTSSGNGSNVMVGWKAGYKNTSGVGNTFIGTSAGYENTTGTQNTFVGPNTGSSASGYYVTTGSKNTILGAYNGNQSSLDIRTTSNNVVLSDGDGEPRLVYYNTAPLTKISGVLTHNYLDTQSKSQINLYDNTNGNTEIASGYSTSDFVVATGGTTGNLSYSSRANGYFVTNTGIVALINTTFTVGSNTYTVTSSSSEGYIYCTPDPIVEAASGTLTGVKYATEGFRVQDDRTARFRSTVGVGNALGSTSGAGITFPATQSASSNANTLDDYEEGTWTGTLTDGTNTTNSDGATYRKVGSLVFVSFQFYNKNISAWNAANLSVSGFPFTVASNHDSFTTVATPNGFSVSGPLAMNFSNGASSSNLYYRGGGANWTAVQKGDITNNGNFSLYMSACYTTS